MPRARFSDAEFALMFESLGPARMARETGMNERALHARRRNVEYRIGRPLVAPSRQLQQRESGGNARAALELRDGIVIVGSDAHYWPGIISTAHAGLVEFCGRMKPDVVVMNGDIVDGARIGRWPSIGWQYTPEFADELECVELRLSEIEAAAPKARRYWPLGNHDARFESLVANKTPELARVKGVHLKDHFPKWHPCWSLWINDQVVLKHRFKSSQHAAFLNAQQSGKSMVTGHLHRGIVYPWSDYTGTRWGVDMPWMGEAHGPQVVDYTEDNPVNWRSGFAVLTFIDGVMCQPELAFTHDVGVIEFRGQRIKV
jgi:hypothetical protein